MQDQSPKHNAISSSNGGTLKSDAGAVVSQVATNDIPQLYERFSFNRAQMMAIANVANQPSLSLTCASQQQKALKFLKRASGWNSPLLALGLKGGAGGETSVANGTSGWGPPPAGGAGAGSGWGAPPPPNPVANAAWGAPAPGQPKTQTGMLFF